MALGDEPVASTQAGELVVPVDEPKRRCPHRLTLDAPATGPGSPCGARPGAHFVRMGGAPVGRTRERAELGRALADLAAGTGTFVLITGEAGIGKSTLLAGLTARAADTAVPTLLGRCVPDRGVPEFWTWARLLAAPAAATLGLHPSLVDLDAADAPATARFRTIVRCAGQLAAAAATGGLVVACEDVHWADGASLALLAHLAREAAGARMLVVATSRDPLPAAVGDLAGQTGVLRVPLGPLEVSDVRDYVGGRDGADPLSLHRRSGGNPLYLRELVRQRAEEDIGTALRDLLLRRLDDLDPGTRSLLDGAAVLGDEVDTDVLAPDPAALARARASGILGEDPREPRRLRWSHALLRSACYDALPRDVRLGWHARVADAGGPPGRVAEHRLRAAEGPAGRARAVAACRAAARDALARRAPREAGAWCLAALEVTDDDATSAAVHIELAEAAFDDDQVADALDACRAAADLAERPVAGPGPRTPGSPDRLDLLARAAVVVRGIGSELVATPVRALCDRARTALGDEDSARHARVLAQHAITLCASDRLDDARAVSARALEMAGRHDPDGEGLDAVLHALHARHEACSGPDHLAERIALGRRMVELSSGRRPEAHMWGLVWRIDAAFATGDRTELDAATDALAGVVDRLGTTRGRWHLLRTRAARAQLAGRLDEAEQLAAEYLALSRETQDLSAQGLYDAFMSGVHEDRGTLDRCRWQPLSEDLARGMPVYLAGAGRTYLLCGDVDRARTYLDELRPQLPGLPRNSMWAPVHVDTIDLALRLGDPATAAESARALRPLSALRVDGGSGCRGAIARHVGVAATACGDHEDAVRFTADAVALERRAGALSVLARAHLAHGRALLGRGGAGDRDRARGALDEAGSLARRLGMRPVAEEAAAVLAELSGARTGPATLTARERETVALVATGMANREVAERLVVSERTVESHVRNALGKLGLANRTQLAAWAVETGLRGRAPSP